MEGFDTVEIEKKLTEFIRDNIDHDMEHILSDFNAMLEYMDNLNEDNNFNASFNAGVEIGRAQLLMELKQAIYSRTPVHPTRYT